MSTTLTRPAPAPRTGAMLLFILAMIATACWLGINLTFPELRKTGIPSTATRLGAVPALPIAIILPLLIVLPVLLRSRRIATILDATPPHWLVGLQVYRIFGGIFLVAWAQSELGGVFALPAGTGDVLVGLLALPTAYLLYLAPRENRQRAIAWNILGILDLVTAITIGFLSSPGPLQLIVQNPPSTLLGTYPTVLIPAFAVPLSLMLHALSLRQLARLQRNQALHGQA
jgi:hypothetical protein